MDTPGLKILNLKSRINRGSLTVDWQQQKKVQVNMMGKLIEIT
jgi:hypothetical protein